MGVRRDSYGTYPQGVSPPVPGGAMREYEIDFVVDCGADPTGTSDCMAAWNRAMTLISTLAADNLTLAYAPGGYKKAFTLLVPPGKYLFSSTSGLTYDFLGKVTYLTIKGYPSASILQFTAGPAGDFGAYANMQYLVWEGLVFEGLNDVNTTSDLDGLLNVNAQQCVLFDKCTFANLVFQTQGIVTQSRTEWRDCDWFNCACKSAARGCIYGLNPSSIVVRRCQFSDAASFLNGKGFPVSKVTANVNWISVDGSNCEYVLLIDSFLDEGCDRNIRVNGGANGTRLLEIRGCLINPAVHLTGVAVVQAIAVDHVVVDGTRQATGVGAFSAPTYFDLQSVKRTEIEDMKLTAGDTWNGTANVVTSDAACGYVKVSNPTGWNETGITAGAAVIRYEEGGIECDVLTAGAAITINRLLKLSAAGTVIELVVGDAGNTAIVRGVAFRTAANGARIAVVRPIQVVTMLNDGAAPIALNGKVTPSGVNAGRIANAGATVSYIGVAQAAAAGALDTPVSVWYLPGDAAIT